jgi:hypothetical protein
MFAASVLSLLVLEIREFVGSRRLRLRRWPAQKGLAADSGLACLAAVGLIFVGSLNGEATLGAAIRGERPAEIADRQLADLGTNLSLGRLKELNIDLSPYWESMWASYFLRDKTVYLLQPTYYPSSVPKAEWTLERVDSGPLPVGQPSVPVNERYRLVQQPPGPFSDASGALDAQITVQSDKVVDGTRVLKVRALNTGSTTWLPFRSPLGGVMVGGSLVDDGGNILVRDLVRSPFTVTKPVAPGWSVDAIVEVEPQYDNGQVALQLVAEGVEWFGKPVIVGSTPTLITP